RGVQGGLQPLSQLAGDLPLPERDRLGDQSHHDGVAGYRLYAPDLRFLKDHIAPAWLLPHTGRGLLHDLAHPRQVLLVGHREINDRPSPSLGFVAYPDNRAVAHVPDHPVHVAQLGDAQAHRLDRSRGVTRVDDITDPVLVLYQHEDPGQVVLHQVLRAESNGEAEDARAGEHRRQVQTQVAGDSDPGDAED